MKYLIFLSICLAFFFFTKNLVPNSDAPFHRNKYDELIINSISEIYATNLPHELRKLLNSYIILDPSNPEDKNKIQKFAQLIIKSHHHNHTKSQAFNEALEYIQIFSEKFFVYEIEKYEDNRFCSVSPSYRVAVFITERKERFEFNIYQNGANKYEFCDVYWGKMTDWVGFDYLDWKIYRKYWI